MSVLKFCIICCRYLLIKFRICARFKVTLLCFVSVVRRAACRQPRGARVHRPGRSTLEVCARAVISAKHMPPPRSRTNDGTRRSSRKCSGGGGGGADRNCCVRGPSNSGGGSSGSTSCGNRSRCRQKIDYGRLIILRDFSTASPDITYYTLILY